MTSNNNNPPPKRQATIFGGIVSDDTQRQQQKRVRRTNDEIHRDNRKKKAGVASMARSLGSFVNRTSANIATAVINFIPWPTIRERDASFEATECNNDFDGNGDDQNPEDDSDEFEYCDGQGDGGGDDRISADEDRTIMGDYLQHIQTQIKEELNTKKDKNDVERWLIDYLKQNEFGIRKEASSYICGRLGIPHCIQGYYRDVIVWLPDIQFNEKPPCPCCKSSNSIFQFFLNNNYGLRAIKIQRLCCYRYLYYPRVSQPQNSHYQLCMPFEYYSRPSPATKSPTYERIAMTKSSCSDSRIGRFNQCQKIGGAATCGQKNLRK